MKKVFYLFVLFLVISCRKDEPTITVTRTLDSYFWIKVNDQTTRHSRDGSALVPLGANLYLLGGWHPDIFPITNNEVYLFSQDLRNTTRLTNAPWEGRHTFGYATDADTVFIFGGDLMLGHYQTDVWTGVRQADTIAWALKNSHVPWGERIVYGSTFHNGSLYVIGGQYNYESPMGSTGDVWKSTDKGINLTRIADHRPEFIQNLSGTSVSAFGFIWVIAGGQYYHNSPEKNTHTNQVLRSKDGVSWERLPDAPFPGRQFPSVIVHDGQIFVFGGVDRYGDLDDLWSLDQSGHWSKVLTGYVKPPARHAAAAASYKGKLVVSTGYFHNDTWALQSR